MKRLCRFLFLGSLHLLQRHFACRADAYELRLQSIPNHLWRFAWINYVQKIVPHIHRDCEACPGFDRVRPGVLCDCFPTAIIQL